MSPRRQARDARVKLIYNPGSGAANAAGARLLDIAAEMQAAGFAPELYVTEPDSDLSGVVRDALDRGITLFAACGGDGTVASVASRLMATHGVLGIIPTGTQNNVALSLGIPADIHAAVALLQGGRRIQVDVGMVDCGKTQRPFLETCSVGLFSALYSSADDLQHGKLLRVGDFLAALITTPPAQMRLLLDTRKEVDILGHVVLVCNMSYTGPHYRVAPTGSYGDGWLDVLVFADPSKLQLLGHVVQAVTRGQEDDPRIQRYRARRVTVETVPAMPVIADGVLLEQAPLHVELRRRALCMVAGDSAPEKLLEEGLV